MNEILSEKQYQREIINELVNRGYIERKYSEQGKINYDRSYALDRDMLFEFLNKSQPDTMTELYKIFKDDTENTIVSVINTTLNYFQPLLMNDQHTIDIL